MAWRAPLRISMSSGRNVDFGTAATLGSQDAPCVLQSILVNSTWSGLRAATSYSANRNFCDASWIRLPGKKRSTESSSASEAGGGDIHREQTRESDDARSSGFSLS